MYNPIDGWAENVVSRYKQLIHSCQSFATLSLVIVNDGSQSGNLELGQQIILKEIPDVQWLEYPINRGKGYALRYGIEPTDSDYIVFTDIDFPYTNESMVHLIKQLISGNFDAVIGTRDQSYYNNLPSSRKWISHILKKLNAKLLGLKISDTQGGLKGFSSELKGTFLQTKIDRYLFDLEFIYLISKKKNIRILPLKVTLRDGVEFSTVKWSILFSEFKNFLKVWFQNN